MNSRSLFAVFLALVLTGCGGDPADQPGGGAVPEPEEEAEVRAIGAAVAEELVKSLGAQLKGALESGGPATAVGICREVAVPLTEAAGAGFDGVTVRRTTLRPRNPENAADETDRSVLSEWLADRADGSDELQPKQRWFEGTVRYYSPLVIGEICLNCHGDPAKFSPDLAAILAESYPGDEATGYALGDLRGAVCVEIPRR